MDVSNLFSGYLLPVTLAVITLGMGLSIDVKDFRNTFIYPKSMLIGLISQMILLPVISFIISFSSNIDPVFKVGLILIAVCPGGATANLVIFMLRGNLALAVSLTIINSLISLFSIPVLVRMGLLVFMGKDTLIHLPYFQTLLNLFIVVIIPAFTGVILRYRYPKFATGLEKPLRYILPVILIGVYFGVIVIEDSEEAAELIDYVNVLYYTLLLNVVSMIAGFITARFSRLTTRNSFTIAVQTGLQNSTLAIFIAATLLNDQMIAIVPIIYGSFSFFSTWLIGYLMKIYGKK